VQGWGSARCDTGNREFREEKIMVTVTGEDKSPKTFEGTAGMTTEEVINLWSKWHPHDTDDELRWELWGTMKRGRGKQRRLREEIQMGRLERAVGTGLDTVHLRAARNSGEVEDDLEVVVGYEDAPLHERSSYNHTEVNGGELYAGAC
jgi:hypothetical protein